MWTMRSPSGGWDCRRWRRARWGSASDGARSRRRQVGDVVAAAPTPGRSRWYMQPVVEVAVPAPTMPVAQHHRTDNLRDRLLVVSRSPPGTMRHRPATVSMTPTPATARPSHPATESRRSSPAHLGHLRHHQHRRRRHRRLDPLRDSRPRPHQHPRVSGASIPSLPWLTLRGASTRRTSRRSRRTSRPSHPGTHTATQHPTTT